LRTNDKQAPSLADAAAGNPLHGYRWQQTLFAARAPGRMTENAEFVQVS
jgi:hypothetical protein